MVGNPLITAILLKKQGSSVVQNSFVGAIDISHFGDIEEYKESVDQFAAAVKALPRLDGVEEIFVPGEPEERVYEDRFKNGVPLPPGSVEKLRAAADRFKVKLPPGL
jgi:ureidoglycolate dehydrogenase (NAD+)